MHHPWHLLGDIKCKLRIFYSNLMSNSVLRYWTEFRNSRKLFFLCSFSLFEAIQWSLCRKCNVWKLAVDQSVSFETQISGNKNTPPPPQKEKRKKKHCPHDSYLLWAQSLLVLFGRNVLSPDPEASSLAGGGGRCLHHGRMSLARWLLYQIGSVSHFRVKRSKWQRTPLFMPADRITACR